MRSRQRWNFLIWFWFRLRRRQFQLAVAFGLGIGLSTWLLINTIALQSAATGPVDAFLVLGGSIRREIYVAQLAKQYPLTPILISHGSQDPCIWLIFQREEAPIQNVWLEKCADSTFGNFYFSLPILKRWGVHKLKLITSPTHLPRAKWMAQILLGAHGIWVEPDIVEEQGIPGNRESWLKTGLDLTRSFFWAGLSQVIQPQCSSVTMLADVDIKAWQRQGWVCERQGSLGEWSVPHLVENCYEFSVSVSLTIGSKMLALGLTHLETAVSENAVAAEVFVKIIH